jgi:uncharacterized protein involved in exopolysaccharide biosynthesis
MKEYREGLDATFKRLLQNQKDIDTNKDIDVIRATINNSNAIINAFKAKLKDVDTANTRTTRKIGKEM